METHTTQFSQSLSEPSFPHLFRCYNLLNTKAPYLSGVFDKMHAEFGVTWAQRFENCLKTIFGSDQTRLETAVYGYVRFAMEGMILQKKFNKTRTYETKSYAEAASEVYQNKDYMFGMYLPGILLSHYLWRHHYAQLDYFYNDFLPLALKHGGQQFFDIGVGSGFYSKEMLVNIKDSKGNGFDLSPSSLQYTVNTLTSYGVADRYNTNLVNIFEVSKTAPFIVNIEVLEHLEDPQSFLNHLYKMMEPKGLGLISAAITAPNADHIYQYNNLGEVLHQIEKAGFKVISSREDRAYQGKKEDELVPINGVAIVTK